jgi:hypothetical protein
MEAARWDEGRVWMQHMMERKRKHFEERRACVANGGCQELLAKSSMGPVACESGSFKIPQYELMIQVTPENTRAGTSTNCPSSPTMISDP